MSTSEIVMSIERQIIRKGGLTIKAGFLIREGNKRVDFVEIPNVVKEELKDGKIINKFAWDSVPKEDLEIAQAKANNIKNGHADHSSPLQGMTFNIENHTQKVRKQIKKKDGTVEHKTEFIPGFFLRGSDNRYGKFSTDRKELEAIVEKANSGEQTVPSLGK